MEIPAFALVRLFEPNGGLSQFNNAKSLHAP